MKELLIDLDINRKESLYEQIYTYIRQDIMDGKISSGERLPSTRLLAQNLQISRSTVETAYEQLVSEGYLEARRGSGYYVCEIGELYSFANGGSVPGREKKTESPRQAAKKVFCNFLPNQIAQDAFPYHTWRKVSREALQDMEQELVRPGQPQGEWELRSQIAKYLYQARGVRCIPDQIIIGAGNEYLLQLLAQVLGKEGKRTVGMESPTYLQAYRTFCNIGYEVSVVPVDRDGMEVEGLYGDPGILLAYVMPSHQFPLGVIMPLKRRLQLLTWANQQEGRYVIEDDHDSEFRYRGKPIPSLHSMSDRERVIYLGTFSNSITPAIRISYMVLPFPLLESYHRTCVFYSSTVSKIQQKAVARFLEGGYFERHLNRMRGVYKNKHDALLQLLKGKDWVAQIYGAYAGLHLAVEVKSPLSEQELIAEAEKRGVLLQGVSECYIVRQEERNGNPVLLLGFGNTSLEEMEKGIEVLGQCINSGSDRLCHKQELCMICPPKPKVLRSDEYMFGL